MAWGARQHDDGSWRLCERKGRTILNVSSKDQPGVEIRWPSRTGAEKCAKELNERYWDAYDRARKGKTPPDNPPFAWAIVDIIHRHGGIAEADYRKIRT